jgi:hypothetical protein
MATETEKILQIERQAFLKSDALRGPWITICRLESHTDGLSLYAALIEKDREQSVLEQAGWDLMLGSGGPSICTGHGDDGPKTEYLRNASEWIEHLAVYRSFPSKDSYVELSEDFRLYHNLYYDASKNVYLKLNDDGQEEEGAIIERTQAKVKLRLLSEYLAVRQMHFVLFFEGNYWSEQTREELGVSTEKDFSVTSAHLRMDFWTGEDAFGDGSKCFSRLLGKMILPCPTDSIPDPFSRKDEKFGEFIIGIDEHGKPVRHTCDHNLLSNNFGANPGEPHYLTPVHFRREVLQKYFDNPQAYSVEDGVVHCRGFWNVRLDNDHPDRVIVFLGDLGRDLPESERHHWLGYNIAPEGKMSETAHMRSFRGWFADPKSSDLVFKRLYQEINREWQAKYGWPFFLPLREEDEHVFKVIRSPLTENPDEFDKLVLYVTKVLIDSLNEAEIAKSITLEEKDKGIKKLAKFLVHLGRTDSADPIQFLRNLQSLRAGSAHRKSSDYKKAAAAFALDEHGFKGAGAKILAEAVSFLEYIRSVIPNP